MAAFQAARTGAQPRDGEFGRIVYIDRELLQLLARLHDLAEIRIADIAAAQLVGGDPRPLGEDAHGELLGRHLEGEKRDSGAVDRAHPAVRTALLPVGEGGVERDIGGERRLAHAGTPRKHHQVRIVQSAQQAVEVGKAGRRPGQVAIALVGALDGLDRVRERHGERPEARIGAPFLGQIEELLLGGLDLVRRRLFEGGVIGIVHHPLADGDQPASQREVVDGAPIVLRVDHGDGGAREPREILRAAGLVERLVPLEIVLERDRVRDLAAFDHPQHGIVDAPMHRQEEMFRQEEARDEVRGFVVDQESAEQGLLRLQVARHLPVGWGLRGDRLEGCGAGHGHLYSLRAGARRAAHENRVDGFRTQPVQPGDGLFVLPPGAPDPAPHAVWAFSQAVM